MGAVCDNTVVDNRFVISKGVVNTFTFTIKADGSSLPISIKTGDRFYASIRRLSDGVEIINKQMQAVSDGSVGDVVNVTGKVNLILNAFDIAPLISSRGAEEDRYYLKPNYALVISCNTAVNGNFVARIPYVFIE